MSPHSSLQVAREHGHNLSTFASLEEARQELFSFRDTHLSILKKVAENQNKFACSYQPESLKGLEQWYFDLYETDTFKSIKLERAIFETCMAMYFGQTAVHNRRAHWIVEKYFLEADKYELGVRRF